LSETDLAAIPDHAGDASFRQRQEQSLRVFGKSFAFGVYMGDSLAHVSWLLSPEALSRETLQVLRLKAGEAEITGCETLPEFRRQGLYCFAIRQICAAARASGVHRIYMKTLEENKASQAGIIKAGLKRVGSIRMWTPPLMPSRVVVLRAIR
jgi:hypothetical protein